MAVTTTSPGRLGFLYPGYAAEDDFARLAARLSPPVVIEVVHTELGEHGDVHTIEALRDMGDLARPDAGDVIVADPALHTVAVPLTLEPRLGNGVMTANRVCVWEALPLVGIDGAAEPAGRLLARSVGGSARGRGDAVQSSRGEG